VRGPAGEAGQPVGAESVDPSVRALAGDAELLGDMGNRKAVPDDPLDEQTTIMRRGVMSFPVTGTHTDRLRLVNDLRVITSAVSLGHDETLVAYEEYPRRSRGGVR